MTKVMRPSCWHQNYGPNGLSAPAQGLCLNFFSSKTADFNILSTQVRYREPMILRSWFRIVRIFNGFEVCIENSVTSITRPALWCQTVIPSDGIYNSHRTTIIDSFSSILFLRKFSLFEYILFYPFWRWNKCIFYQEIFCSASKTSWRHARGRLTSPGIRRKYAEWLKSRKTLSRTQESILCNCWERAVLLVFRMPGVVLAVLGVCGPFPLIVFWQHEEFDSIDACLATIGMNFIFVDCIDV